MEEDKKDELLDKVGKWHKKSSDDRSSHEARWVKNTEISKGIFPSDESSRSKVRNRSKIYFRKVWSTNWRLLASFYQAFFQDPDNFDMEGRDTQNDPNKARLLKFIMEYRLDRMRATQSLFINLLWGLLDILTLGWCVGKFRWVYKEDEDGNKIKDEPEFIIYPPEQVFPDFSADTPDKMRYIIFENYMDKDELKENKYDNIDDAEPENISFSSLRSARYSDSRGFIQDPGDTEYPRPGKYYDNEKDQSKYERYKVWEVFYRDGDKIMFAVTNKDKAVLKKPEQSKYGECIPSIMGSCLLEPHRLIGEGFPQPLEGPQESYNTNMNQRKDNVSLALNGRYIASRYGNVDLQALTNSIPGGVVLADEPDAVRDLKIPDVTQSSYAEGQIDDSMMQEMSGVVPGKLGMGDEEKATVAQINYNESNAKINLYIAIVVETFMKPFYSTLAKLILLFEEDEKIFRIANEAMQKDGYINQDEKLGLKALDFEADLIVKVGPGALGKELQTRQTLMAIDRANMYNQSMGAMAQAGAIPPDGIKLIDVTALMEDLLPNLGKKDLKRYFYTVQVPSQGQAEGGGSMSQGAQGAMASQIGEGEIPSLAEEAMMGI